MPTLYEILGISPDSTFDQIKKAYRDNVNIHHPDHGGDPEKFQEVKHAYDILSDPDKRKQYDLTGFIEKDSISINDEVFVYIRGRLNNLLINTKGSINIIQRLIVETNQMKVKTLKSIDKLEDEYKHILDVGTRFHIIDNDQIDIIGQIFIQNLNEIKDIINTNRHKLQILEKSLTVLVNYKFI